MPQYTYACPQCGRETDVVHAVHEQFRIACNECSIATIGIGLGKLSEAGTAQHFVYMQKMPPRRVIATRNANQTLLNTLDDRFRNWKHRQRKLERKA